MKNICGEIFLHPFRTNAVLRNNESQTLRVWLISSCPFGTKRDVAALVV